MQEKDELAVAREGKFMGNRGKQKSAKGKTDMQKTSRGRAQ